MLNREHLEQYVIYKKLSNKFINESLTKLRRIAREIKEFNLGLTLLAVELYRFQIFPKPLPEDYKTVIDLIDTQKATIIVDEKLIKLSKKKTILAVSETIVQTSKQKRKDTSRDKSKLRPPLVFRGMNLKSLLYRRSSLDSDSDRRLLFRS